MNKRKITDYLGVTVSCHAFAFRWRSRLFDNAELITGLVGVLDESYHTLPHRYVPVIRLLFVCRNQTSSSKCRVNGTYRKGATIQTKLR